MGSRLELGLHFFFFFFKETLQSVNLVAITLFARSQIGTVEHTYSKATYIIICYDVEHVEL